MRNLLLVFYVLCAVSVAVAEEAAKPTVAVLLCKEGDEESHYDAYNNMPPLMEQLGKKFGWNVVIVKSQKYAEMPSLEVLDKADTLVVYVRRIALPKKEMDRVKKYVNESGKGLVCIRTTCHGFHVNGKISEGCEDWKGFDQLVLGGNYRGHGHNDIGGEVWENSKLKNSPVLKNVRPEIWHTNGSVYFNTPVKEDCTVYQYSGSTEKGKMPLTWTRIYNGTRVAYTALGHKTDFPLPAFQTLIGNLINWSMSFEHPAK